VRALAAAPATLVLRYPSALFRGVEGWFLLACLNCPLQSRCGCKLGDHFDLCPSNRFNLFQGVVGATLQSGSCVRALTSFESLRSFASLPMPCAFVTGEA
jgi:hypothetical protein